MVEKTGDRLLSALAAEMRNPEASLLQETAEPLACLIGVLSGKPAVKDMSDPPGRRRLTHSVLSSSTHRAEGRSGDGKCDEAWEELDNVCCSHEYNRHDGESGCVINC